MSRINVGAIKRALEAGAVVDDCVGEEELLALVAVVEALPDVLVLAEGMAAQQRASALRFAPEDMLGTHRRDAEAAAAAVERAQAALAPFAPPEARHG